MTDNITKGTEIKNTNFESELNKNGDRTNVSYEDDDENKNFLVNFRDTNHEYIVDRNGNITLKTNVMPEEQIVVLSKIRAWESNANTDFHKESIRNTITEIEFVDYLPNPIILNDDNCWDVSQEQDQSVIAWLDETKLYIGGEGGVKANEDSSCVFSNFSNVENINFNNSYDISDVETMEYMFYMNASSSPKLENINWGNKYNALNITNMHAIYWGNKSLKSLDFSGFDTKNVTDMSHMMPRCISLTYLDFTNLDTRNVTKMEYMMADCTNLKTIYISNKFVLANVITSEKMFNNDIALVGGMEQNLIRVKLIKNMPLLMVQIIYQDTLQT